MIRSLIPLLLAGAAFGSVSEDLQRFEGFSATSYVDTTGHRTVGFGHRTDESVTMSRKTALAVLADDITKAEQGVRHVFPSYDSQSLNVQEVLTMMAFQLGASGCAQFIRFNQALESRDYRRAASEMMQVAGINKHLAGSTNWPKESRKLNEP